MSRSWLYGEVDVTGQVRRHTHGRGLEIVYAGAGRTIAMHEELLWRAGEVFD